MHTQARVDAARSARARAYALLGPISARPIAPVLDPEGPPVGWPTRPAWRVLRRPGRVGLLSDGLSDPWPDREGAGLGLELVVETDAAIPDQRVITSWLFEVMAKVCGAVVGQPDLVDWLFARGLVSMQLDGAGLPRDALSPGGALGVLLGGPAGGLPLGFALPEGPVRLVPIRVLEPAELARVAEGDEGVRQAIAAARPDGLSRMLGG